MNKDPLHKQLEGNPAVIVLNFKISQQYKNVHKRKLGKRTQEYCRDISSAPAPRQWPGGASKKCGGNSGSVCRSGTPDRPFVSHLWTRCGNIYVCTVLKQACQHQEMTNRCCRHRPCCGHHSMSAYGTPWASPASLLVLGACVPRLPCGMAVSA